MAELRYGGPHHIHLRVFTLSEPLMARRTLSSRTDQFGPGGRVRTGT